MTTQIKPISVVLNKHWSFTLDDMLGLTRRAHNGKYVKLLQLIYEMPNCGKNRLLGWLDAIINEAHKVEDKEAPDMEQEVRDDFYSTKEAISDACNYADEQKWLNRFRVLLLRDFFYSLWYFGGTDFRELVLTAEDLKQLVADTYA